MATLEGVTVEDLTDDRAVSQAQMRRHNLSLAFTTIWERGHTTRADLARSMRLSKPAVTRIVGDLIDAGYVDEVAPERGGGRGRPGTRLVPRAGGHAFIGIDLRLDRILLQSRDLSGAVLAESSEPLRTPTTASGLVDILLTSLSDFRAVSSGRVAAVGIAVGGRVDAGGELLVGAMYRDWHDVPLARHVRSALGDATVPVRMANVARCAALANWRELSSDPDVQDLVHLQVGLGAGVGWIRRRQSGHQYGVPGGVAHLPLDRSGPVCSCGGRGCLDIMVGFDAFVELARAAGVTRRSGPEELRSLCRAVVERADEGNEAAQAAIEELASRVAQAGATLATILRPSRLTIGGYPLYLGPRFEDAFVRAARPHLPEIDTILATTGLGDEASLVGAYLLGVEAIAEDPLGAVPPAVSAAG